MSDVGSLTSDSLAQTNKSVTVKHLRTLAMGPKEAIKYSQKRSAHHLRRKKTNKRFCHFLLMRATVVHYNRKQARLWAWKAHGNKSLALCDLSQVWCGPRYHGGTELNHYGIGGWSQHLKCLNWQLFRNYPLQLGTEGKHKPSRLPGTWWPRKLISILANLDCTLIWMGSTASGGILFCHRLKNTRAKAIKLARLAHKDKCAVIRPDHSCDWSFVWWPWQPQSSHSSFPETAVRRKSSHNT